MDSCTAICASVRPWATSLTNSRSRALSFPDPSAAAGGGVHERELGRDIQADCTMTLRLRPRTTAIHRLGIRVWPRFLHLIRHDQVVIASSGTPQMLANAMYRVGTGHSLV
jgi:hypothetical protein